MKKSLFYFVLFLNFHLFSQTSVSVDTIAYRKYLKEFELNLTWDAFEEVYKTERERVITLVDNCSSLNCLANTLLEVEFYVAWAAVDNPWRIRRGLWVDEVKQVKTYSDLVKLTLEFEKSIHSYATSQIWRERKFAWRNEMESLYKK